MSTLAVVEGILRDAAVPLSVREIVERAGDTLPTKSKTPDTVVARDLSMDIKKKGEGSLFIRTSPGRYAIREQVMQQQHDVAEGTATATQAAAASQPMPATQPAPEPRPAVDGAPAPTSVISQALSSERAPTRPASKPTPSSSEEMSA